MCLTRICRLHHLLQLLRTVNTERDSKRKRDVIKKVIAYMTLGIDVSRLFSDMVLVSGWQGSSYRCSSVGGIVACPLRVVRACRHLRSSLSCAVAGLQHQGSRHQKDGVLVSLRLRTNEPRADTARYQHPPKGLVRDRRLIALQHTCVHLA